MTVLVLALCAVTSFGAVAEVDTHGALMRRGRTAARKHKVISAHVEAIASTVPEAAQNTEGSAGRRRHHTGGTTAQHAHHRHHGHHHRGQTPAAAPGPAPPPPPATALGPPTLVKWEAHEDKCLAIAGAMVTDANASLVLWDCADAQNLDNMKFMMPTANNSGNIKWNKDPTKCVYVHNGWTGNGNTLHLWSCDDAEHSQNMNFTNVMFGRSSWIEWGPDPNVPPTSIFDVDKESQAKGSKIEIWDTTCNTTWLFYEPDPVVDPAIQPES